MAAVLFGSSFRNKFDFDLKSDIRQTHHRHAGLFWLCKVTHLIYFSCCEKQLTLHTVSWVLICSTPKIFVGNKHQVLEAQGKCIYNEDVVKKVDYLQIHTKEAFYMSLFHSWHLNQISDPYICEHLDCTAIHPSIHKNTRSFHRAYVELRPAPGRRACSTA